MKIMTQNRQGLIDTNGADIFLDCDEEWYFVTLIKGKTKCRLGQYVEIVTAKKEFMQAWAEAYQIYLSGKFNLVLPKELQAYAEELQEECREDDPNVGIIQNWLDTCNLKYVCNLMIASEALGVDNPDRRIINNIVSIMSNSIKGWERDGTHRFSGVYGKQKCYVRIKPTDDFMYVGDNEKLPFD